MSGRFVVGNVVLLDGLLAVGVVATWPIHRSPWVVATAAVAIAAATAIAVVGATRGWRWWLVAAVTTGVYLVVAPPLAAPAMLADPSMVGPGLLGVVTAPVTGWKGLLTLDLPVGTYQATSAPLFLLLLALGVLALSLALRAPRAWVLAAPAALLVTVFGVAFGSSATNGTIRIGGWELHGAAELAVGLGALCVALAWLLWRSVHARREALHAARRASGVRRRARRPALARVAASTGMLVVALVAGVALAPVALAGATRDVLRTAIDPELRVRAELSPLTDYRRYFSDALYDEPLFTVTADAGIDRVRLAALTFYDGRVMQATDPAGGADDQRTSFARVPSSLAGGADDSVTARITIGAYTGPWVPTVGALAAIDFEGSARSALSDGFFYNAQSGTGVELADPGLGADVAYRQDGRASAERRDPATLTPSRGGPATAPELVPESLRSWIRAQDVPAGGAGLAELIRRLRARGLLSHALTVDAGATPAWMDALGEDAFEPSRAGHSTDRIDALFTALGERQSEVGGTDDAALVAAVGDDEQFAVAAALVADQLGFPARVVVGARLAPTGDGLPACTEGVCTGGDIAAWIEVQDVDGSWVAIDVTPQHEVPLSPEVRQRRDPHNPTEVTPEHADTILPPEADPADSGARDETDPPASADLAWLWGALRFAGVVLLALVALLTVPAAVVAAKRLRRRSRRTSPDPVDRVVGGWEEYVDSAVDAGLRPPPAGTRTEIAEAFSGRGGAGPALAVRADRAVFAPLAPSEAESEEFWALVDAERRRLRDGGGRWARWRARLSLRSFRGAP